MLDREYYDETILAYLPSGRTVCEINGFAIWSRKHSRPYGVINVDRPKIVVSGN